MENSNQQSLPWSFFEKILFKFFFILFLLFIVFENNGAFPFFDYITYYPNELLHQFIPFGGFNGSGDTTYDYTLVLGIFIAAIAGAIIWTLIDRNKKSYTILYYYLTVAVRFYLGLMLISYGFFKVFKTQFPYPGLNRLMQPYGDSSPMGLAWTFLGFSKGYNLFMGFAEISAVLILFRRTMTAGAIIALMTTTNVMAVNYFYDVPVKILSTFLVMMCIFLLAHDIKRLITFFFTGNAVSLPVIKAPVIRTKWLLYGLKGFKILLIVYVVGNLIIEESEATKIYGEDAPKPALYGVYDVETFVLGRDTLPAVLGNNTRWKQLIIEYPGFARVKFMNDSTGRFTFSDDEINREINMHLSKSVSVSPKIQIKDSGMTFKFNYEIPDEDHLVLAGASGSDSLLVQFKKRETNQTLLMGRGFHWINEFPFNR